MLELKNLGKVFNEGTVNENRAINNINIKVEQGEFITIIGSNGAGKSTLFNLISGSYGPSEGTVFLRGDDVTNQPEHIRARHIGRIYQNTMLGTASNMTLEDNMMICSRKGFKGLKISLNRSRREFFREKLKELDMGLENRLKDNVGLFSGGQRQALTLLMMVLSEPDLVLLDEHTAALDPKNADLVLGLTVKFIKDFNLTSMMITHNMDHAIKYGSRLLMMDRGEVILDVKGEEKKNLTIPELVERFHIIRKRDFANDEALLSD